MNAHAPSKPQREINAWIAERALRTRTGASMLDCQKALRECRGDQVRAVEWIRARMLCG